MKGEVVGINSNILTSGFAGNIGIGFAIPSDIAKKVVVQLKDKGRVVRGRLGVQTFARDLTEGMVKQYKLKAKAGALISAVEPDSPAEKAKLRPRTTRTCASRSPTSPPGPRSTWSSSATARR